MTPKKIIFCDIDDVIFDTIPEVIRRYNHDYEDTLKFENVNTWNIQDLVVPRAKNHFHEYFYEGDLYKDVSLIHNSVWGIHGLRYLGFRVVFATASFHYGKFARLMSCGFIGGSEDWVVTKDKSLLRGEILIDDNAENVANFSGLSYLFDKPWNRGYEHNRRVNTWVELVTRIKRLSDSDVGTLRDDVNE